MDWNDIFNYCPDTGALSWKIRLPRSASKIGEVAGCLNKRGYMQVMVRGKTYKLHRIIYEMVNGPIPSGLQIDHINHIKDDNRLVNLRLVDQSANSRNRKLHSSNTSGTCGVGWDKNSGKWRARIKVNDVYMHLGLFTDITLAIKARKDAERLHGFHPNHGEYEVVEE